VVLLSTHIVEDVTELCQHFAILADGAVRLHTTPRAALETLDGHVFEATSEEARAYAPPGATTLSTRLVGGVPHVRVWSETPLGPPYRTTPPELSDVYFHCLRTQRPEAP
jgi:ABC-type multidrug transport system ATPase subunit